MRMNLRILVAALSLMVLAGCAGLEPSDGKRELVVSATTDACSGLRPASTCYCRMARIRCQ